MCFTGANALWPELHAYAACDEWVVRQGTDLSHISVRSQSDLSQISVRPRPDSSQISAGLIAANRLKQVRNTTQYSRLSPARCRLLTNQSILGCDGQCVSLGYLSAATAISCCHSNNASSPVASSEGVQSNLAHCTAQDPETLPASHITAAAKQMTQLQWVHPACT